MAFLGDFGRTFLGGMTTRDVGGSIGETLGGLFFGPGGSIAGGSIGRDIGKDLGEIGSNTVDVSAPPAGVDSVATTIPISQTSAFENQAGMSRGMDSRQAFIGGGLVGPAVTGLSRLFTKPGVGGALTGIGGALGFDLITDMFGNTKKLVITRKLQRDVKKVFMMSGGDLGFVSNNSMMLFGKSLSQDQVLMILFKTFKNQGPYVTKAAVRKTRSTIKKMETLCDLKDRLCPPRRAPARRRMPAKSTTITNVR